MNLKAKVLINVAIWLAVGIVLFALSAWRPSLRYSSCASVAMICLWIIVGLVAFLRQKRVHEQ